MADFKPCGCGWFSDKEYEECTAHSEQRKELEKLRKREKGYLSELADYARTVAQLRQELERLRKEKLNENVDGESRCHVQQAPAR